MAADKKPAVLTGEALGMIETRGFVGMIEATDATVSYTHLTLPTILRV